VCKGYTWLLAARNADGGWSSPEWTDSDAATTGHIVRVLVELCAADNHVLCEAVDFLLGNRIDQTEHMAWPARATQLLADRTKPWLEGTLCATLSLLSYASLPEAHIPRKTLSALVASGKSWVRHCLETQEQVWEYGLWWLCVCASILSHAHGSPSLWRRLRAECDRRLCGDRTHWRKAPGADEDLLHSVNVLQCLMRFPRRDSHAIAPGIRYLLDNAVKDGKQRVVYWPCQPTKLRTGPLLITRYVLWLLCEARQAGIPGTASDETEAAIYGSARWLAMRRRGNGCWTEKSERRSLPSITAYAVLAVWRALNAACAEDDRGRLRHLLAGEIETRTATDRAHVFISYVHENQKKVGHLRAELERHGVKTWSDKDLQAGKDWKLQIRRAIEQGQAFAACFSPQAILKKRSYMRRELAEAMEELMLRPHDQSWFIPIKLFRCEIPDEDIGRGKTLRDLQWVELYRDWKGGVQKILSAIRASASRTRGPG